MLKIHLGILVHLEVLATVVQLADLFISANGTGDIKKLFPAFHKPEMVQREGLLRR